MKLEQIIYSTGKYSFIMPKDKDLGTQKQGNFYILLLLLPD